MKTSIERLAEEELVRDLNKLGAEGWSLVATVPHERHGYSHEVHLLFSRILAN